MEITRGKICKHIKTGNFYMIHSEGKVKIGMMWCNSVNYVALRKAEDMIPGEQQPSKGIYTRRLDNFSTKFDTKVTMRDYEEWAGVRVTSPDWIDIILKS